MSLAMFMYVCLSVSLSLSLRLSSSLSRSLSLYHSLCFSTLVSLVEHNTELELESNEKAADLPLVHQDMLPPVKPRTIKAESDPLKIK